VMASNTSYYVVVYSFLNRQVNGQSQMFTISVVSQTLTVTAPDSTTTLSTGADVAIGWTSSNIPAGATMKINLKQQTSSLLSTVKSWFSVSSYKPISTVVDGTPNSGLFTWTVPLSLPAGVGYVFDVIWTANGLTATSSALNAIVGARALAVTLPSAGLTWYLTGTEKTIEWSSMGIDGTFDIALYYVENTLSSMRATLAQGVSGSRAYVTLPAMLGDGTYFVRVSSSSMPAFLADSAPFTIAYSGTGGLFVGNDKNALTADIAFAAAPTITAATVMTTIAVVAALLALAL